MITKDMTIASILESYSHKATELSEVMTQAGLHCVGCGSSSFETLEEGLLGHGMNEEDVHDLLGKLNTIVSQQEQDQHTEAQLSFTQAAVQQVQFLMKNDARAKYLRVSVLKGGCAGYSYNMKFEEQGKPSDLTLSFGNVSICIDPKSAELLQGMEVDYVNTLTESGFKFKNPNASASCGCGKSFR